MSRTSRYTIPPRRHGSTTLPRAGWYRERPEDATGRARALGLLASLPRRHDCTGVLAPPIGPDAMARPAIAGAGPVAAESSVVGSEPITHCRLSQRPR